MRESRVRGGAASWASLAAVAVCGGAQGCNSAERAGCEAWVDSPAIATGPEKKEFFVYLRLAAFRTGPGVPAGRRLGFRAPKVRLMWEPGPAF